MEGYLEKCDPLDERQFSLAVKRLADSLAFGTDSSPYHGSGIDYVQSRPYEPGDPIKAIDWRVTARTGKYFIKEYEAPKRLPLYLLVDTSASMVLTSARLSKYAWAVQIAGGLAFAALNRVSPVGVLGVGERELRVKPSLSRDQIMQWLHRLRHYRTDERTSLGSRVRELAPSLAHRAVVMVLSDLHDPGAVPALKLMAQRHDCVVLQLQDPAERDLRGGGIFRGQEAETGERFVTHGRAAWLEQEEVERELKRGQIDHLVLPVDQPFVHRLRNFLNRRDNLAKGTR